MAPRRIRDHTVVTMGTNRKTIPAGRFKARCLALLDEVERTRAELVVTKRGRPVAKVVAVQPRKVRPLAGSIVADGDLLSPLPVKWDATR